LGSTASTTGQLRVAKFLPASDDLVEFAQDHGMDHETVVGFTKVLYNASLAVPHLGIGPARTKKRIRAVSWR
jgi:hypothetical protein